MERKKPDQVLAVATAEGRFQDERWQVRKDGTQYWASFVITALRDENGKLTGFSKIARDITKRKQAEDEIRRLNTELERRLQTLTALRDRDHRALDVLYRVSMACRGMTSQRAIFDVLSRELRGIFTLDACYIGLSDMRQPGRFRWALLYDEGLIDYVENAEFGPITGRMVRERTPIFIADLDEVL